jgi:hypothetical protein
LEPEYPGQDAHSDRLRLGARVCTDPEGNFAIPGLAKGHYLFKVHWNDTISVYEDEVDLGREESAHRVIVVPNGPVLSGFVRTQSSAIPDDIHLSLHTKSGKRLCRVGVGEQGGFRFPGLRKNNEYDLWIEARDDGDIRRSLVGSYYPSQAEVTVRYPLAEDRAE